MIVVGAFFFILFSFFGSEVGFSRFGLRFVLLYC